MSTTARRYRSVPTLHLDPVPAPRMLGRMLNIGTEDVLVLASMVLVVTALVSVAKRWGARRP